MRIVKRQRAIDPGRNTERAICYTQGGELEVGCQSDGRRNKLIAADPHATDL